MHPVLAAILTSALAFSPVRGTDSDLPTAPAANMRPEQASPFVLDHERIPRELIVSGVQLLGGDVDWSGVVVLFVTRASLCWTLLDEIFEYHQMITAGAAPEPVQVAIALDAENRDVAEHWFNSTALGIPSLLGMQPSAMEALAHYKGQDFQEQIVLYDGKEERVLFRAPLQSLTPESHKEPVVEAILKMLSPSPGVRQSD